MMSALEQFLIDENWLVALGALRRQFVYTRLAESTWVAALINELKEEEEWLTKKKFTTPNAKAKAKGAGRERAEEGA